MNVLSTLARMHYRLFLSFFLIPTLAFSQTNLIKFSGNPILPLGAPGEWDDTEASHAFVAFDGAAFQMWYSGASQENTYRIGYATSPDGLSWTKDATNPVLDVGGANSFDGFNLWTPHVYADESGYQMWYSGGLTISGIGYATSPDPSSWIRQSSQPVLEKGNSGMWDEDYAYLPIILRNGSSYQMWYTGRSADGLVQTGYATSTDGMYWSKHANNPVLSVGGPGEWDSDGASAGSVLFEDGQYHMWYSNWSNPITNIKIGYATSTDGINWIKHAENPILQPASGGWDAKNVWFPTVVKDGHRYRMWYTGTVPGTSLDRLGYAEDFSKAAHVDSMWVSRKTAVAGLHTNEFYAHIANPHNENLTARALIVNDGGSLNASIELKLIHNETDLWRGKWLIPDNPDNYSVSVELTNHSANYVHNSFDWGLFDEFHSNARTHSFTEHAHIADGSGGAAGFGVAVSSDGTVFLANYSDGLRAYRYDGTSFTNTAHIDDGGNAAIASSVFINTNGTIFLANGGDGLRAYTYDGHLFTNTAHVNNSGFTQSVVVAPDDSTVFLAGSTPGLQAYHYDGHAFTSLGSIDDGGPDVSAGDVFVAPDGTVYLANGFDGLRVYTFDGTSFTNTANDSASAHAVAVAPDNTIFVGGCDGLRAYTYNGTSLTRMAEFEMRGCAFSGALALATDGTVFLTIAADVFVQDPGLWAFQYENDLFRNTAYNPPDGFGIALGQDGTVFHAGRQGLFAYTYNMTTGVNEKISAVPEKFKLEQNYPNPFNPTTTIEFALAESGIVTLKVYNVLGAEVATLVEGRKGAGRHTISFEAAGLASGLYYYTLTAGEFRQSRKMVLLR
ncbi:MAG: T9SS C-terminal target domain-containing protein [Calditrichaeota bacterium]|nr:MAG: T9SS C-terminal target domain-containing protein [Calditrichota bacterium]